MFAEAKQEPKDCLPWWSEKGVRQLGMLPLLMPCRFLTVDTSEDCTAESHTYLGGLQLINRYRLSLFAWGANSTGWDFLC
jgi:hypothetical protein